MTIRVCFFGASGAVPASCMCGISSLGDGLPGLDVHPDVAVVRRAHHDLRLAVVLRNAWLHLSLFPASRRKPWTPAKGEKNWSRSVDGRPGWLGGRGGWVGGEVVSHGVRRGRQWGGTARGKEDKVDFSPVPAMGGQEEAATTSGT